MTVDSYGSSGRRLLRWEPLAGVLCVALSFVPVVRVPAAFTLLCLLPGVAICRHRLGETSAVRVLILGSLISLCIVPTVTIPAALLTGRPIGWLSALIVLAVTSVASLRPAVPRTESSLPGSARTHLAVVASLCLMMQIAMSLATHPDTHTIRWRGMPDLMFFGGIYSQLTLHMPPMDPENGAALLIHNWIYHFHFALLHLISGLDIAATQRVGSAWMALMLLGLIYLLCADVLKRPAAGLLACLLLMTSGELYWVVRSIVHLTPLFRPMPWANTPLGVMLLFGWYNLPPLAVALGAWYWFERYRSGGRHVDLAASIAMCVVLAFFHPVYYGAFMIGFCSWLVWLWLKEGAKPLRLAYLATPLPFLLLYKLPYYGGSMPPQVVLPTLSVAALTSHAWDLAMSGGLFLGLGALGLAAEAPLAGPLGWIAGTSLLLWVTTRTPNTHWFSDLPYIALAIASGLGLAWLRRALPRAGVAAIAMTFMVGGFAFVMHVGQALTVGHAFTAAERAAGAWLSSHTQADDLVATLPNSPSSYTVIGLGRRRLVHGWTLHLVDFHDYARRQESEVREIFTTGDPERAVLLARRYRLDYLYLGSQELAASPKGLTSSCFPIVFTGEATEIRKFTCAFPSKDAG